MIHSGLEFYTTQELVDELMRRQTFLGVVIHAANEVKHSGWSGEQVFKVHLNDNLGKEEAARLLDVIAERMDHLPEP